MFTILQQLELTQLYRAGISRRLAQQVWLWTHQKLCGLRTTLNGSTKIIEDRHIGDKHTPISISAHQGLRVKHVYGTKWISPCSPCSYALPAACFAGRDKPLVVWLCMRVLMVGFDMVALRVYSLLLFYTSVYYWF